MLPGLYLSPRQTLAPSLVVTNRLLGCNLLALPQHLLVEAADNPTLQLLPTRTCPRCGFPLDEQHVCALCARRRSAPAASPEMPEDWEERLPAPEDVRQALLSQARLALDRSDHALAEFIIAALDEHGLLSGEAAAGLPQRAERVLRVIQSLDPPGIAARNTAECFRLQLDRLDLPAPRAVHRLIERWPDLPESRAALARALHVTPEELDEARKFMQQYLRPYPVMDAPDARPFWRVDVAILPALTPGGAFEIIVAPGPHVRVCDDPAALGSADFSRDDWRALARRGQLVGRALNQRRRIIEDVFAEVAQRQAAFLREGLRQHQPLTRAAVAHALGVHAATVGRAAAGKSVLIPSGQVIPAALFFERGAAIKHAIKEIIAQETTPLTDEQMRACLVEQGIVIARRTVAKYRAAAGALPVHLRWE
jgi:RNA polymerase sigma-54 factor